MRGEIQTESYVCRGGETVPTAELTPAERTRLAQWLKGAYLNELYRGQAEVSAQTGPEA